MSFKPGDPMFITVLNCKMKSLNVKYLKIGQ